MQPSPRFAHTQGHCGSGAAHRSSAAPVSLPPLTPRKTGKQLDARLHAFEGKHRLGLDTSTGDKSSPSTKTKEGTATRLIQQLHYAPGDPLSAVFSSFDFIVPFVAKEKRLDALLELLRKHASYRTPVSRSRTPINASDLPIKALEVPQSCKCTFQIADLQHTILKLYSLNAHRGV